MKNTLIMIKCSRDLGLITKCGLSQVMASLGTFLNLLEVYVSLWTCFWRNWWIPLLLLGLLWGAMHFINGKKDSIPSDVKSLVTNNLVANGYNTVDVEADGREVTLKGVVTSEDAKSKIISLAKSTTGAKGHVAPRTVKWVGEVKVPEPPKPIVLRDGSINADVKDGVVTLTGVLASQQEIDAALSSAYSNFGAANVVNRLTVGENIKPIAGLNGLLSGLDLENGALRLRGQTVNLTGQVGDLATKSAAAAGVIKALGPKFRVNNRLTVFKPEPVVPQENLVCQNELTSLMSKSKIFFETSSAVIKSGSYALLDNIASIVGQCPKAAIAVEGHTDASGGDAMNLDLSKRRAQAVVSYLSGKGAGANLSSIGYGETKPIASNADREGRAQNRRSGYY